LTIASARRKSADGGCGFGFDAGLAAAVLVAAVRALPPHPAAATRINAAPAASAAVRLDLPPRGTPPR
jgi:hypothetical protein